MAEPKPTVHFTEARADAERASDAELAAMVREQARIINSMDDAWALDEEPLWEAANRLERHG